MHESTAIAALSALAQPMRLRVFRALIGAGPAGMTPGALGVLLDVPASTLSFHLKALVHADLVGQERDGRHLVYRAAVPTMAALLAYLTAHCCQGQPCDVPASLAPAPCCPPTPP